MGRWSLGGSQRDPSGEKPLDETKTRRCVGAEGGHLIDQGSILLQSLHDAMSTIGHFTGGSDQAVADHSFRQLVSLVTREPPFAAD